MGKRMTTAEVNAMCVAERRRAENVADRARARFVGGDEHPDRAEEECDEMAFGRNFDPHGDAGIDTEAIL